ncbi:MAG: aminoacyl-tRNA hydrolase, partial [Firmicutes bacterium]|nr:aminoacyl-tRNA hydrolase [Bacillota bacterium]
GFLFIDYISDKLGFSVSRAKFHALTGEYTIEGVRVLFMKPQTYMNSSGIAVREAADFYKIPPEHILIVNDDVSLSTGVLRIRKKGSDGGHNGLKSIIYQLNSDAFPRMKIGVGEKPSPEWDLADWVLGKFSKDDETRIFDALTRASMALPLIVSGNIEAAQNKYSG